MTDEIKTGYIAENGLVVSPVGILAFHSAFVARGNRLDAAKAPEFVAELLFPADADLTILRQVAANAAREKWGAQLDNPAFRAALKKPIRDQIERLVKGPKEGYTAGQFFMRASAKQEFKPQVRDAANGGEILEPRLLYAGCYARLILAPFTYETKGNMGVSFGLRGIQKVRDGEPFKSAGDATAAFRPVAGAAPAANVGGQSAANDLL